MSGDTIDSGRRGVDTFRESVPQNTAPQLRPQQMWRASSSLHFRLILLVAGTMLPLLTLAGVIVYQSYQTARTAAAERVLQTTRTGIAAVDRELQNQFAALEFLALSPNLQGGNFEAFRAEAERFTTRFPNDTAVSVSNAAGQQVFNTKVPPGGELPMRGSLDGVRHVFAHKTPYVTDLYIALLSQLPTFTIEVPVMREGAVVYNLAFNSPRPVFAEILRNLNLPEGWVVSIFDRNAHHIARIPALSQTEITSAAESLRAELDRGSDRIAQTISLEGTPLLTAFSRSAESGWAVAIGIPREQLYEPAQRTLIVALILGGVIMLVGVAFASRLATQLARAEGHREMLINELNHRVKNTLAAVQSIVARGLKDAPSPAEARKTIDARLMALSRAHNTLSSRNWESAELTDIATAVFEPYAVAGASRIALHGPRVTLKPRIAIPLAMILNELVTNAVKYGALSSAAGKVDISWTPIDGQRLRLNWKESGGPPVQPPTRSGFGTQFIERAAASELNGAYTASYQPEGLSCAIDFML